MFNVYNRMVMADFTPFSNFYFFTILRPAKVTLTPFSDYHFCCRDSVFGFFYPPKLSVLLSLIFGVTRYQVIPPPSWSAQLLPHSTTPPLLLLLDPDPLLPYIYSHKIFQKRLYCTVPLSRLPVDW